MPVNEPSLMVGGPVRWRSGERLVEVDAEGLSYRELNRLLRSLDRKRVEKVRLINVQGQRYIGAGLLHIREIELHGTPGNDLGCFMNGPAITVYGNVQDGCGNTMSGGSIIVHGSAGDILGYSMRNGRIFVKGDVGYRAGIHMKEYRSHKPLIVVGGSAGDFLGEYMAGGLLVLLGLNNLEKHEAKYVGTGMHGGAMYIHGEVKHMGAEVEKVDLSQEDQTLLKDIIKEFCKHFNLDHEQVAEREYYKVRPKSTRPYGDLYAY